MVQFSISRVFEILPSLLSYIPVTLLVLILSVFFGTLIGLVVASWQLGENRVLRGLAKAYVFILRCTPAIVLLFLVYYGVPFLLLSLFGLNINHVSTAVFVIIALLLLFGASSGETFRSAYLAIDEGQTEAALSVGMSPWQAFKRIVFPQALVVALPNYANSIIDILKAGALAYTIGLIDVMGGANLIIGQNFGNFSLETYTAAALIYWVLVIILELIFRSLTKWASNDELSHQEVADLETRGGVS